MDFLVNVVFLVTKFVVFIGWAFGISLDGRGTHLEHRAQV